MIKLFEMFAGYGGASFALKKLNIEFECVGYSEIDKYAIQCYDQNHHDIKNYGDCTKINTDDLPDFDLLTGGFPCQDVSIAGKRDLEKGRTNLYSEILRIAKAKQPKYMLLENVAGLLSMEKKSRDLINIIVSDLKRIGYQVCWKLLNSKDFGIPQSRNRVWIVCFRDDIYEPFKFQYPTPEPLKIFIKDILEEQVDEKYYLSEKLQERFTKYLEDKNRIVNLQPREGKGIGGKGTISKNDGTTYCVDTANTQGIVAMRQRDRHDKDEERGQQLEPRQDGCSNSLTSVQKDNLVMDYRNDEGFRIRKNNVSPTLAASHHSETEISMMPPIVTNNNHISSTLTTELAHSTGGDFIRSGQAEKILRSIESSGDLERPKVLDLYNQTGNNQCSITLTEPHHNNLRLLNKNKLRRLTPKECFRLMGFFNDEINLEGLSDTQIYKLAGNGWALRPAMDILKRLVG